MRRVFAIAWLWLGWSSLAAADAPAPAAKVRVAIVPSIAVNLDVSRVDALSQDLAEALAGELEVEAVGGLEVRRRLPAEGLPTDCVATPSWRAFSTSTAAATSWASRR